MAKKQATLDPAESLRTILRTRAAAKKKYAKCDLLIAQLVAAGHVGAELELPDGTVATLIDQFADRNTVFRTSGVSRYDVVVKKRAGCLAEKKS